MVHTPGEDAPHPHRELEMATDRSIERREDLRSVAISSILEVTSDFVTVREVDKLLDKIVTTVSETFGLRTACIGIRDKETGLFVVRAAHGFDPEVAEKIKKVRYDMDRMTRDLRPEFKVGRNVYYVPAGSYEIENEDEMLFVIHPERMDNARRFPDEWHELDFVDFLMYEKDGSLMGYLEIDEPEDHKVPDDETFRAIEIFSDLAAIAIQNAQLYEQLEKDRKEIELLIDLIGHDVNNYAQAVSGFIELAMSRKGVPEPIRKSLAKGLDQVWNLNKLVSNVKLYAKVEAAGNRDLRPIDLVRALREAQAAAESYDRSRKVRFAWNCDDEQKLSPMNDFAKDIFLNLFTNAIKFDQHEDVVIQVDIGETVDDKREMWLVSVLDRGPGVEDEFKQKIFDRFTQGPARGQGGSGLGLHIAKTLVDSYKGRIWVEDRVEGDRSKGSVFRVLLPKAVES
jgi:signal transduction histidine kinase